LHIQKPSKYRVQLTIAAIKEAVFHPWAVESHMAEGILWSFYHTITNPIYMNSILKTSAINICLKKQELII
jgi:hypothetical protein